MVATTKYRPTVLCGCCKIAMTRAATGLCAGCRGEEPTEPIPAERPTPEAMAEFVKWVNVKSRDWGMTTGEMQEAGYPVTKDQFPQWQLEHGHEELPDVDLDWSDEEEADDGDTGAEILPVRKSCAAIRQHGLRSVRHAGAAEDHPVVPGEHAAGVGLFDADSTEEQGRTGIAMDSRPRPIAGTYRQPSLFDTGD
jgi:hypothetical protein